MLQRTAASFLTVCVMFLKRENLIYGYIVLVLCVYTAHLLSHERFIQDMFWMSVHLKLLSVASSVVQNFYFFDLYVILCFTSYFWSITLKSLRHTATHLLMGGRQPSCERLSQMKTEQQSPGE